VDFLDKFVFSAPLFSFAPYIPPPQSMGESKKDIVINISGKIMKFYPK